MQMCTRFLHACSALCKCANWLCRTCNPHHTVAGRSSLSHSESVRLPLQLPMRPSPHQLHAGPFHPVHACTHRSSHTVRCARLVHLWSNGTAWSDSWISTYQTTISPRRKRLIYKLIVIRRTRDSRTWISVKIHTFYLFCFFAIIAFHYTSVYWASNRKQMKITDYCTRIFVRYSKVQQLM
jgi:hypothetical protein